MILQDFQLQTGKVVAANQLDIVVVDKQRKRAVMIDVICIDQWPLALMATRRVFGVFVVIMILMTLTDESHKPKHVSPAIKICSLQVLTSCGHKSQKADVSNWWTNMQNNFKMLFNASVWRPNMHLLFPFKNIGLYFYQ